MIDCGLISQRNCRIFNKLKFHIECWQKRAREAWIDLSFTLAVYNVFIASEQQPIN